MEIDETKCEPGKHARSSRGVQTDRVEAMATSRHASDVVHVLSALGLRDVPTVVTFR